MKSLTEYRKESLLHKVILKPIWTLIESKLDFLRQNFITLISERKIQFERWYRHENHNSKKFGDIKNYLKNMNKLLYTRTSMLFSTTLFWCILYVLTYIETRLYKCIINDYYAVIIVTTHKYNFVCFASSSFFLKSSFLRLSCV